MITHPYLADVTYLADASAITTKATAIGWGVLGAGVVIALIAAFLISGQRRWIVIFTIIAIGAVISMFISSPRAMLESGGNWFKTNIWDNVVG